MSNDQPKTPGAMVLANAHRSEKALCDLQSLAVFLENLKAQVYPAHNHDLTGEYVKANIGHTSKGASFHLKGLRDSIGYLIEQHIQAEDAAPAEHPPAVGGEPEILAIFNADGSSLFQTKAGFERKITGSDIELIDRAHVAPLLAELDILRSGFFQQVSDADLKKISDFVGDGDLPTKSFFMRPDAAYLANVTMHMVRDVQAMRNRIAELEAAQGEAARYIVKADALLAELGCPLDEVIDLFEAQPATAKVDENAQFESWRKEQIASLVRMGYPDAAKAFDGLGSVQWAGWQARAKLNPAQS